MAINLRSFPKSILAVLTTCVALVGAPGLAHADSPVLAGTLTTHQVECPTLCTTGVMTGGLAGRLDWVMDTMTPTDNPDVFLYTGTNTVTTASGTLAGTDHGIWNIVTGEFVDYTNFSLETGAYRKKRGSLSITGVFDPVAGQGHSNYFSVLVRF